MADKFNPTDYVRTNNKGQFIDVSSGKVISINRAQKIISQARIQFNKIPIGVPKGYQVAPQLSPEDQASQNAAYAYGYPQAKVGPHYFKGDETGNGVSNFPTDPDTIATLQQHLVEIGYLKAGKYIPSQWGISSSHAFSQLLAEANHSGQDWLTQLNGDLSIESKQAALSKSIHTPLAVKLTDAGQIADTVNTVAKDLHGTYLTPDQLTAFTQQFQANEQRYQTEAYAATGYNPATGQQDVARGTDPGSPGVDVVFKPPDITSAAKDAVRNLNPAQFEANTLTDRLDEVLSGLRSNISTDVGPLR